MTGHAWTLVPRVTGSYGTDYRSADGRWTATVGVRTGVKPERVEILLLSTAQFIEDRG